MYAFDALMAQRLRNLAAAIHARSGREVRAKYAREWSEALNALADEFDEEIWFEGRCEPDEPDGSGDPS